MQLSQGQQHTLYQVFIDLKKVYDTLNRGRTLEILKGYGVGPKLLAIIRNFWSEHTVVARQGVYHGEAFKAEQGVTQGDIPSPTIFNIIVDCVVRAWSWEMSDGNHAAIDGGSVETEVTAGCYADDGVIASTYPVRMQIGLDSLVELFERTGLLSNTSKTKSMVCTQNSLKGHISNQAYKRRMSGQGPTYISRQKRRVQCPICEEELAKGCLSRHLRNIHGMSPLDVSLGTEVRQRTPVAYVISFPPYCSEVVCPVEG
jgi:hypothetical protein